LRGLMTPRHFLLAVMIAAPVAVWAQASPALKAPFEAMRANVGKISNAAERERWETNVAIWQVKIGRADKLEPADLAKMRASFDTMKANVAKITAAAEKERWQANCDLWQVLLAAAPNKVAKADRDKMRTTLDLIKANVAKIAVPAERERWDANHQLWVLTLRTM